MEKEKNFHQAVKTINRTLADYLSAINAIVAVAAPLVIGLSMGSVMGNSLFRGFSVIGFIGGFIGGMLVGGAVVAVVCGQIAVQIDIRNRLADRGRTSDL